MTFKSHKQQLTQFLTDFLLHKKQDLRNTFFAPDVFERLSSLIVGGKMLRGSLLINTFEQLAGQDHNSVTLTSAAALELSQAGFLIHDDIIDQDQLRRGQDTLHQQYALRAQDKKYRQPAHMGQSLALCVGDLVFFLVYELLAEVHNPRLLTTFTHYLSVVTLGEMQDVELAFTDIKQVSKEEILQVHRDKTASYSICLPLLVGAVLAKQTEQVLSQLEQVGQSLGLIFQIKDDELGLFASQQKIGKPVGADIREGKKTLHYYYLAQQVKGADEKIMREAFGNVNLKPDQVDIVRQLMTTYQISQLVAADVVELASQVKHQIDKLSTPTKFKQMLQQFLELNLNRGY